MNANIKNIRYYKLIPNILVYKYCMVVNMQLLGLHKQANKNETTGNKKSQFLKGLTALIFKNHILHDVYVSHLMCAVLVCCSRRFSNDSPCASTAVATMTSASSDIWAKSSRAQKSISFVRRLP